jgi:uncharacterized protein (TIGR02118 family)
MVKLVVLYGPPADPAAFDEYYAGTHAGLAAKLDGVKKFEAAHVVATPDGSPPPYHLMAELWFDSAEELQATMASDAGQAVSGDLANFATGGATFLIAAVD